MSSETPAPLSRTQNSSGSETRSWLPGDGDANAGRKAVDSVISPFGSGPIASAAFFTRLRKTCTSWSRLA